MKKLRKAIALFVVMIMAVSLMPQVVMAAQVDDAYLYGWTRNAENDDTGFSYIDGNEAVSGNNSLYIENTAEAWAKCVSVDQAITIPVGTYTLSFWVKGEYHEWTATILSEGGDWQTHKFANTEYPDDATEFTYTDGENGWKKLEKTLTVTAANSNIRIVSDGGQSGLYIDDIKLVNNATKENLIENGGFEYTTAHEHTWDEGVVTTEPTVGAEGVKTYTCTECGDQKTETIEKLDDPYLYGWYTTGTATANDNVKSYVVTDTAVSGTNSLYVQHNDSNQTWSYYGARQDVDIPAGDYTLSFWVSGEYDGSMCTILSGDGNWQTHKFDSSEPSDNPYTTTTGANGWTKLEKTVTISSANSYILISSDGNSAGFYIDDISLVNSSGEDLIENGSFENKAPVQVDDAYLYGWYRNAENDEIGYSYVMENVAVSGNNSLYIENTAADWAKCVSVDQDVTIPAGTYTLSFWVKGEFNEWTATILSEGDDWQTHKFANTEYPDDATEFTYTNGENGWKKLEKTLTVTAANRNIRIVSDGGQSGLYIDDIKLVNNETKENLIENGGFEYTTAHEHTWDEGVVTTAPTISTEGVKTFTCTGCGDQKTEVIEKIVVQQVDDAYLYGWYIDNVATANDNVKSYVVKNNAVSGDNSLYIQHNDSNQTWSYYGVKQDVAIPAGDYTLSFWVSGEYAGNMTTILLGDGSWQTHKFDSSEPSDNPYTTTTDANGWTKLEKTVTITNANTYILIASDGNTNGFYIDDIRLVNSSGEDLITNGSFEDKEPVKVDDAYLYGWYIDNVATANDNVKSYVVTNIAVSGDNSLYIQHNDSNQTWSYYGVKQDVAIPAGNYTLSFWVSGDYDGSMCTILTGDGSWQTHKFDSSEPSDNPYTTTAGAGGWTKLEKTVTITNANTYILIASDGNTAGFYIDDVRLVNSSGEDLITNGSFEDKAPVQVDDAYLNGWYIDNVATANDNVKSYVVTNTAVSGNNSLYIQHNDSNQSWSYYGVKQDVAIPAGNYTLSFWVSGDYDGSMCTILTGNGDWQTHKFDSSEPSDNPYTTTVGAGGWTKFEKTVTITNANTYILIASDGNTDGFYIDDISLVKEGTTYNLIKNGSFEDGGYYVFDPKVINLDGDTEVELTNVETGTLEVRVQLKNYSMGDNFDPIMIVALYDNRTLVEMATAQQFIYESSMESSFADELCITIDVPEMTESTAYKLRVMCWDGWDTLKPLRNVLELN